MAENKRLLGLANRRQLNNMAGDATQQNRLQRSSTALAPSYNRLNQARRSSGLVQRGQARDASFRHANRSFDQRQENSDRDFDLRKRGLAMSEMSNERSFAANREDAAFSKESSTKRLGLAEKAQEFSQADSTARFGLAQDANRRANQGQQFSQGIANQNQARQIEGDSISFEGGRLRNEGLRRQLDSRPQVDFEKTFKDGSEIRSAREAGVDVSGFQDEAGEFTPAGIEYLDALQTAFNTNGGNIQEARKTAAGGTLLVSQNAISARIQELESAKRSGAFSDGTSFDGNHELELEDERISLSQNATRLNKISPNYQNPEKQRQQAVLTKGVFGALDVADGITGDSPVDIAKKAIAAKEYLDSKKININNLGGQSAKAKELVALIKKADPQLVKLGDDLEKEQEKVARAQRRLDTIRQDTSSISGRRVRSAAQDDVKNSKVSVIQEKINKYVKNKGGQ